jgi:mxaJ protein
VFRIALVLCFACGVVRADESRARDLRVCADPNNYPFSSEHEPGFEDAIAEVVAHALHAHVTYTYRAARRGFVRETLGANRCDVIIGAPIGLERVRLTAPYYRSSFAFVSRTDRHLDIASLDDPRLTSLRIGVQLVGDDGANPPPAHALARRGIVTNVRGFHVIGDYAKPAPTTAILHAVETGEIDVAIVWGPLAGAYAAHAKTPLTVTPVAETTDGGLPLAFDIAMAVRRDDTGLAAELDRVLVGHRAEIQRVLTAWHIPSTAP